MSRKNTKRRKDYIMLFSAADNRQLPYIPRSDRMAKKDIDVGKASQYYDVNEKLETSDG